MCVVNGCVMSLGGRTWPCPHCSFINKQSNQKCEMCGIANLGKMQHPRHNFLFSITFPMFEWNATSPIASTPTWTATGLLGVFQSKPAPFYGIAIYMYGMFHSNLSPIWLPHLPRMGYTILWWLPFSKPEWHKKMNLPLFCKYSILFNAELLLYDTNK